MISTDFGNFDGDLWQRVCKICFLQKFSNERYVEIVASPGDFGLEGFTKTGKAFQCYCPDRTYTSTELHNKIRDKITSDLQKLKIFENQLATRLGDTKIATWYFVTPEYTRNEILAHCVKKEREVRSWGLSIIENSSFEVIPTDIDFLHPHLKAALDGAGTSIVLLPDKIGDGDIVQYEADSDYLVANAKTKHLKRISQAGSSTSTVDRLTHRTIKNFLDGLNILQKYQELVPEDYEKFVMIAEQEAEDVEDLCLSPSSDHNRRYMDVMQRVESKIQISFPYLDARTVKDLANYVVADWILRCPLSFTDVTA